MEKLISIITTCKNAAEFIEETIYSVFQQTYNDYEHIIIDDGSNDNTVEIVENFIVQNPKSKLKIIRSGGVGRGAALNMGVKLASGTYIAIIDADDLWHPEKLALQYAIMTLHNIDVLATGSVLFTDTRDVQFGKFPENHWRYIEGSLFYSNQLSHSSVLMRRELCEYDESRKSQFDYALWLSLYTRGKKLAILDNDLTFHRIHSNQSFESKMGKVYTWRSFKLKAYYAVQTKKPVPLIYNSVKLLFDLTVPKKARLLVKRLIK